MTRNTVKYAVREGPPPRGAAAIKVFVSAVLLFALFCVLPMLAVRGAGALAAHAASTLGEGAKTAAEALSGLADAHVTPNFTFCAVCAAVCALLILKRRTAASILARGMITALTVFTVVSAAALSVWVCKINGVPVRVFVSILSDVLSSGLI